MQNPTIKSKRISVTLLFTFTILFSTIQAQQTIPTTGADATGTGGSVSYTIGQVVYMTNSGINGSVAEGVQQPYEISVVTAIEEAKGINLSILAYPNPTTDYLTLSINDNVKTSHDLSLMSYQLYDMSGKLLQTDKITGTQTSIVMSNLVPVTYFLKVIQGNKEIKTFKIIKTQ